MSEVSNGSHRTDVAVVGYSVRAPNCSSATEFAHALKAGKDLTTPDTRYPHGFLGLPPRQGRLKDQDLATFDASFFGLSHKQAEVMDPGIRVLLKVSYEALLDAQIPIEEIRGSKTGVYVGHCFSDSLGHFSGPKNADRTGYELVNGAHCMAANRLSFFYDLHGPSMTVDTACSSSLVALDRAVHDIRAGIVDRAIVGGISVTLDPYKNASFNAFTMLSPSGRCYSFDSRANGYCRSEGVACVILERGTRGYVCVSTGTNSDGKTPQGITYPSSRLQLALMKQVFAEANIDESQVVYHEAHGTGTIAGDREELLALSELYKHHLRIGSVKSNMGHAEGASGLVGLVKLLLMHEDHHLFPNFDYVESSHEVIQSGRFSVVQTAEGWKPGICSLSNFGFGGSNAFAILSPCAQRKQCRIPACNVIGTPFSSNPGPVPSPSQAPFYAIQRHIGNGAAFQFEWAGEDWVKTSPLIFVCDGQGSQWDKMGQDMMERLPVFRQTIERIELETGIPLVAMYENGNQWMSKGKSTLGIVSFQLALLSVLAEHGIKPDFFLGHSLGEITCAYLSGLQTEAEVMRVAQVRSELTSRIDKSTRFDVYECEPASGYDYVYFRSSRKYFVKRVHQEFGKDPGVAQSFLMKGKMVVVGCEAALVEEEIENLGLDETCVACYNAPRGQTISGPSVQVDYLVQELKKRTPTLFARELDTDEIAYHAPYLQVFQEHLKKEFGSIPTQILPSSWLSTSRRDIFNVDYLVGNICGPVYFQEAVEALPKRATVVEIGPSSGLLAQIKRTRTDLNLVGLVERNMRFDLEGALERLARWRVSSEPSNAFRMNGMPRHELHYDQRFPDIWGNHQAYQVPSWQDFDLPQASAAAKEISYDLSQAPWSSIREHCIRGQNLFPAAGFIHAIWSVCSFEEGTEIRNFRIDEPLIISSSMQKVVLRIYKTGEYCEVRDASAEACYASAYLQRTPSTMRAGGTPAVTVGGGMECRFFYPDIRRLGYEYGPSYRLLDNVTHSSANFQTRPTNWIAYVDACIHLEIFGRVCLGYPKSIDRIVLWSNTLSTASLWIERRGQNTFGNDTVLLEGLRLEYVPVVTSTPSVHTEAFVEYGETEAQDPFLLAALLSRESRSFRVSETLTSPELKEIVACLRELATTQEKKSSNAVVISDEISNEAELLLTTDNKKPSSAHCLVARWGRVRLLRFGNDQTSMVIRSWKDVPKADRFVWRGMGSSGAVGSLAEERNQTVFSYEDDGHDRPLTGLEKGMRHNFLRSNGQHGVWVDCKCFPQPSEPLEARNARLHIGRPGILDSLEWHAVDAAQYEVKIDAATLNFRDVMRAMGQLKEEDLSLGLEFSGTDIGNKRVFGIAKSALSTHARPVFCFPTPEHLTNEQAATIPIVYLTAYFSMFEKANMKAGQSILVHAGTGGVGMAAITLAQKRGLVVYTTCSEAKRHLIKEKFGLADEQIGDSRSDDFVRTVLAGTAGRGVDVVLNQLSGALQIASLRCVADGGHFCEIGKYDILQNKPLGQALLASNISFHAIDLLPLLLEPSNKKMWYDWLSEGFGSNEIVPLPVTTFDVDEVVDAFRFMSQGKHTGKIVINGFGSRAFPVKRPLISARNEAHLITGGLGGLGLSLAFCLAQCGCKELLLVGRKGVTTGFQRQKIAGIESMGCKVSVLKTSLLDLKKDAAKPDRIWHAATVYDDLLFDEMTERAWDTVVGTKVNGYKRLRQCWPSTPIVAISSVVSYFGNAAQTHYGFANAFLDGMARVDDRTVSVRLGTLDNVGFITKAEGHRKLFERLPFEVMRVDDVLSRLLQISTEHQSGVFGIYDLKNPHQNVRDTPTNAGKSGPYTIKDAQVLMANVLGGSPDLYEDTVSLKAAGLDSLSTMEVVHHINQMCGSQSFKASQIDSDFTVQDIVEAVLANCDEMTVDCSKLSNNSSTDCSAEETIQYKSEKQEAFNEIRNEYEPGAVAENVTRKNMLDVAFPPFADWVDERKKAGLRFALTFTWWVTSLAAFGYQDTERVLLYAQFVAFVGFCLHVFVDKRRGSLSSTEEKLFLSRCLQRCLSFIAYGILYALGNNVFTQVWSTVFLGFYSFDSLVMLAFWDCLSLDVCKFHCIYNVCALACTAFWHLPSGDWDTPLSFGLMLWLTAEIWQNGFSAHDQLFGTSFLTESLRARAFAVERLQRVCSYAVFYLVCDLSPLACLVFATTLALDAITIYFQKKAPLHKSHPLEAK